MKTRLIAIAALLCVAVTAFAQDEPEFSKRYSIEIGTGMPPLYMSDYPSYAVQKRLEQLGQAPVADDVFHPVVSLSGVVQVNPKTEFVLTSGVSWNHNKLMQYPVFGTDPYGKPRYDLDKGLPAGTLDSSPIFSVLFQYRHLWNPQDVLVVYSAAGIGYAFTLGFPPLPSLTPIALRLGGNHIYGFAEFTIGPIATFVHGGLGWHF